ncbi:MAG: DUF4175 domain-containing protein [Gemmatimonadetes bacterium]|nr:DUF4175 domain-containing protein [Gemmatimonadota bacterium]
MTARARAILSDGLLAGFIGYATIVLVVAAGDLLQGRPPFHTAGMLGALLFYDVSDPTVVLEPWPGPVLAFNGAHLLVMLLFGIFLTWLVALAERGPELWYIGLVALLFVLLHALGLTLWLPDMAAGGLSPWLVAFATAVAVITMGLFLWRTHPALRARLRAHPD